MLEIPVKAKLVEVYITQNGITTKKNKCNIPIGQTYRIKKDPLYPNAIEVEHEMIPSTVLFYEEMDVKDNALTVKRNVRVGSENPRFETFIFELEESY
ncbi:hypothetical protein [Caldalkalibacillus mannanilyticus]|uniref:hypothetical protein n=1 Tax=Caldalkalibacillus mannanilyticus TaxID=1418 RepID=UPI000469EA25|nr:hypothetical protein [Caldalkalibacillus mannanilyticus]